jgi:eukaryotic-like serine/threonine-protein kinase
MPFEIGQSIGNYEILDVLDATVSGVTYKVRNQLAARFEALKILPSDFREDRERVERFLREAKAHARLTHPNIAAFYNAMEIDDELVMTMELVPGMTIEQRLMQGPVKLENAVHYGVQVLEGLAFAHANGVVHRNISPASIMVTPKGEAKIIEFGLAKAVGDPRLTLTGMVLGPMHYIAPEQVKGLPTVDARTDIYSLGIVLYELVTGKKAFDAKRQFDVMEAQVREMPAPPSEVVPGLPAALDRVIMTAIAKEPEQRYQTAEEFRAALGRVLQAPEDLLQATLDASRFELVPSDVPPLDRMNEDEMPAGLEDTQEIPVAALEAVSAMGGKDYFEDKASHNSASHDSAETPLNHAAAQAQPSTPRKVTSRPSRPRQPKEEPNGIDPIMVCAASFVGTIVILFFLYIIR